MRRGLLLALTALLLGCGAGPQAGFGPVEPLPTPGSLLVCSGEPFPHAGLHGPAVTEADDEAALAFREWFEAEAREPLARGGPEGWWVLQRSSDTAEFATGGHPEEQHPYQTVVFEREGAEWRFLRGGGCTPRPFHPGGSAASWWPTDLVAAETSQLDIEVRERACASGESAEGRILDPVIRSDEHTVVVSVFVRPLDGDQTCPSNPATPFTLDLDEPLGDRELLDGGVYPPRDPAPDG